MSSHPANLGLRFLLEIAALVSLGIWGWQQGEGWVRFLLAIGIPVIAATLWATYRVPNDPGKAPVPIPGILRLFFEIVFFTFATWALYDSKFVALAWIFGILTFFHYISSYDRLLWMVKQ